mmetsp:Transcript_4206/g.10818  ORF Transcript_4206/g.10818 Transcript_4206/m.10818 type:complete len:381 (+) Transcript_4206:1355-2497(+)
MSAFVVCVYVFESNQGLMVVWSLGSVLFVFLEDLFVPLLRPGVAGFHFDVVGRVEVPQEEVSRDEQAHIDGKESHDVPRQIPFGKVEGVQEKIPLHVHVQARGVKLHRQPRHFVHKQDLESVVKDRHVLHPRQPSRQGLCVGEEASKEEADEEGDNGGEGSEARGGRHDRDDHAERARGQVEQGKSREEDQDVRGRAPQPDRPVHDQGVNHCREDSQEQPVEGGLGKEVGADSVVVSLELARADGPFGDEEVDGGQAAESEEGEGEEDESRAVLQAGEVVRHVLEDDGPRGAHEEAHRHVQLEQGRVPQDVCPRAPEQDRQLAVQRLVRVRRHQRPLSPWGEVQHGLAGGRERRIHVEGVPGAAGGGGGEKGGGGGGGCV